MGYQQYAPPPGAPAMEPPEVQSIRSMLHIVRILAVIFGILLLLGGLAWAAAVAYFYSVCSTLTGDAYCGAGLGFLLIGPILIIIFGVIDFIIYMQMKEIEALTNQHQYEAAKSKTLMWMVLGFILGGIILGILLLIAYLKFDPVINWSRNQGMQPGMAYGAPPPGQPYAPAPPMAPPAAAPPPPAPAAPQAPACPKCGQPTTWVAQYGRYYCYTDKQYV
jgi:hypothetical protein